jgi:hypothetical protein
MFPDGYIYLQSEEGETIVLAPGPTYLEVARNNLKERTLASCALADGALFIRTEQLLHRIDERR